MINILYCPNCNTIIKLMNSRSLVYHCKKCKHTYSKKYIENKLNNVNSQFDNSDVSLFNGLGGENK